MLLNEHDLRASGQSDICKISELLGSRRLHGYELRRAHTANTVGPASRIHGRKTLLVCVRTFADVTCSGGHGPIRP